MRHLSFSVLAVSAPFLLAACGKSAETAAPPTDAPLACEEAFVVGSSGSEVLNLKAKVVADEVRNVSAGIAGAVEALDCEKGKPVKAGALVAKIVPDPTDPSVRTLASQRDALALQISNTEGIRTSTKANFATQLGSLSTQKANLDTQERLLSSNLAKIVEQKSYGVKDIDKQLELLALQLKTADVQIADLRASEKKLEESKTADVAKIAAGIRNSRSQAKALVSNALVQIDETYGISDKNREKNDAFETYLSAKNEGLKNGVVSGWTSANAALAGFDALSDDAVANYLQTVSELLAKTKESVKASVPTSVLTQTSVDGLFNTFAQYETNVISAKNGIETAVRSLETVRNGYDNQILALSTQIDAAENAKASIRANVENVKDNKLGTYVSSLDLQKNQAESSLETVRTNRAGVLSQIDALRSQQEISLNQLDNQLAQLRSSLATVNANLLPQSLFSDTDGTFKERPVTAGNKVVPGAVLCQILPAKSGFKVQVFSSSEIPLPAPVAFAADGKTYASELRTRLPYQDPATQNFLYEITAATVGGKPADFAALSEGRILDVAVTLAGNPKSAAKILIPIDFVENTITGFRVKTRSADGKVVKKDVVPGDLDSDRIAVKSGLSVGDTVCR